MASSSNSFFDDFNKEKVVCSDGVERPIGVIHCCRANAFWSAYAILAYCDQLEAKGHLTRDRLLLKAFTSLTLQQKSGKTTTDRVVSMRDLAQKVVDLYDNYLDFQFVETTILANHRPGKGAYCSLWTSETNANGKKVLNPTEEGKTMLSRASMSQLVRTFTFYLVETVRRMFPRGLDESEWESSAATYVVENARGRSTQSSADFATFAEVLLEVYDEVCLMSEDCHEYQELEDTAVAAGNAERDSRQPQRRAQPRVGRRPQVQQPEEKPKSQRKIQVRTTKTVGAQPNRFATLPTEGDDEAADVDVAIA